MLQRTTGWLAHRKELSLELELEERREQVERVLASYQERIHQELIATSFDEATCIKNLQCFATELGSLEIMLYILELQLESRAFSASLEAGS